MNSPWPNARAWPEALGLLGGVVLLSLGAILLSRQPGSVATVWLANALAVGIVASAPAGRSARLLGITALGNLLANLLVGDTLLLSLSFAAINTAEVALGSALLRQGGALQRSFQHPRAFLDSLLRGIGVPPLLSAAVAAGLLQAQGVSDFATLWFDWYVGAVLGGTMVLPLVIRVRELGLRQVRARVSLPQLGMHALLGPGVGLIALNGLAYPFIYMMVPATLAAYSLPPVGGLLVCLLQGLTLSVALDLGWFLPPASVTQYWQHLQVYVPMILSLLTLQVLIVALERQRQQARSIAALNSATDDLLVFIDMQGRIRSVNATWRRYWGLDPESLLGQPAEAIVPAARRLPGMERRLAQALRGETVRMRIQLDFFALGPRTIDIAYQPATGLDGRRIGVLFTGHDVSELLASQHALEAHVTQLERVNQQLEQFARISAHDLREPLNTIVQFTGLIEQDHLSRLPPEAQRSFAFVKQGAQRLRVLLDDLLDYVRLDRALQSPERQAVSLDDVLDGVLDGLQARVGERGARVLREPLPTVPGPASLLALLLQNLVGNALKFVPPERRPEVRISARPLGDGQRVELCVADNGIGIAAEDLPKLFEPFRRLHNRRRFEGSGLGLAACRRIVEHLGGHIRIESEPGVGSRFLVELPAA